jgi:2-C-methyl-D-erythritol 4-phosphate cytidylyltransferase
MALLMSSSSYTRGRAMYGLYSSSKAAVVNLAQAIAEEWAPTVRVNVLCPARTDTPMRRRAFGVEPPGSLLQPARVAEAALDALMMPTSGQVFEVRWSG